MEHITMIMSGLALLAAMVSLILTIREKKRNQKRNADMSNYVEYSRKALRDEIDLGCDVLSERIDSLKEDVIHNSACIDKLQNDFEAQSTKVDKLEQGIVPDYQEALAAKNSVDEFNRGLSAIMGYDPMEIARKTRENRKYGGEVE